MSAAKTIPNLSGLPVHSHGVVLNRFFRGGGPKDDVVYALWMNFVRLADVAVREYELARSVLMSSDRSKISRTIVAIGHFESLLTTLKRCIDHLKALRGNRATPQSMKNLLPRRLKVLTGGVERRITKMRDSIQHLERDLITGCIIQGEPVCLKPSKNGIELGNQKISYTEIAVWVRELHDLAGNVVLYKE